MEENIDWLFDDPLPTVEFVDSDDLKTEVKCEAGCKEELLAGTVVKAEGTVKEEVQVKVEREDKASEVQCLCLSSPGCCGGCVLKCGRAEASSEGGCVELEGDQYLYKRNGKGKWHVLSYVDVKRETETGLGGGGSLGLAEGEQCLEGGSVCEQEQAVDGAAGFGRWQVIKVEGGDEYGSIYVREEKWRRDAGRGGVVQSMISKEDCKMEVNSEFCEETGVEMVDEGEKVQVEGGVPVQASPSSSVTIGVRWSVCGGQWSDGSSAPVASSSSPRVCEARPCVSSEETAQLSHLGRQPCGPPRQQQCRKKARVQRAGGLKKHVLSHRNYRCMWKSTRVERIHEGEKKYACPKCQYKAGWKSHLKTHIDTVHEGLRKYACPHCQYRAGRRGTLQAHIGAVHEGLKKHACPHCQYRALLRSTLQMHLVKVHEGLKKYACPLCQYRSAWKGHVQRHIETVHEGLKKYACPHCQYRSGLKCSLKRHIDSVHEGFKKHKEHACPHCQYRAGQKGHLQKHIDTVHEGLKKYACPHCQYRAGQKGALQTHIDTVHEGLKKYACPHCQYRAGQKGGLQIHIDTVHEGLKKYACPHCQYRAGQKCNLQRHINIVHEGLRK